MKDIEKILYLHKAGRVRRWHTEDHLNSQDVAQHTFGVAFLVDILAKEDLTLDLLRAALYHDAAEQKVGDIPCVAKWRKLEMWNAIEADEDHVLSIVVPVPYTLTADEMEILAWADKLELLIHCIREASCGSTKADSPWVRVNEWAHKQREKWDDNIKPHRMRISALMGDLRVLGRKYGLGREIRDVFEIPIF